MRYPVAVWSEEGAFSAEVPDLPGVITEADSIPELEEFVVEAACGWMEAELDDGRAIPEPTEVGKLFENEEYKGCTWLLVDIDLDSLSDKVERVNITLPSRALRRLDALANRNGETRSGCIARMVYNQA